jgi:hypothetical protein
MLPETPIIGEPSLADKVSTLFKGQLALHALMEHYDERISALEAMVVYEEESDDA